MARRGSSADSHTESDVGSPYFFEGTERFKLIAPLGSGGMGVVFEAYDRDNDGSVALKLLPSLSASAATRFKNEFRALQGIHHPNLVGLRELFDHRGQLFFTMDLVRGVDIIAFSHGVGRRELTTLAAATATEATLRAQATMESGTIVAASRMATLQGLDETRLRSAFSQLARALLALHACGKLHRDVKPSNVLVTDAGKTLLLDFGLIVDLKHKLGKDDFGLGTVSYMSPEQAAGAALSPASDWYSVGVMLYEALSGRLPFVGPPDEVLMRKQTEAVPPLESSASAPDVLVRLCHQLLQREPAARPGASEILSALAPDGESTGPGSAPTLQSSFVGRAAELTQLAERLRGGESSPLITIIEGESGVGKTALAHEFLARSAASDPSLLVFRGRCSERELVPFKAFDAVAEDIVRQLEERLPRALGEPLALAALEDASLAFPVLARLSQATTPVEPPTTIDAHVKRHLAFRGVRSLFELLGRHHRLILCIDDWQWVDADSIALFGALLAPPQPPPLLLLLTCRPDAPLHLAERHAVERLRLGNLTETDARQLALQLLTRVPTGTVPTAAARDIALESTGHPLFIAELVRQLLAPGRTHSVLPRLDDTLCARFSALPPALQAAIELLASAGSPLTLLELRDAIVELEGSLCVDFIHAIARLRDENFVRSDGLSASDRIDCFHDRVASAVLSRVDPARRERCHQALATVLERREPRDLEALTLHWRAAGDPRRAAHYAGLAGDRAMTAVAFEHAVDFYRLAIDLATEQSVVSLVQEKLGDVLSHLGRGREAADAYLASASADNGERQVELLRVAADQLFRSGYVDDAVALIDRVFQELELSLPRSPRQALLWLAFMRVRVRLRGTSFERRSTSSIPPLQLARVDALWSVAIGLSTVDNLRGGYMQSRHLLMALELGEPFRVLRALAAESGYHAVAGVAASERVERLLESADVLARELRDPYAYGFVHLARGISSFLHGHWSKAWRSCEDAVSIFEQRPVMASWELASARMFSLWASFYQGDFAITRDRVPALINEAERRGDLYAATCLGLSLCNAAWLIIDEPGEARRHLTEADQRWSNDGIHLQHYWSAVAWINLELYEGNAHAAYAHVKRIQPLLKRGLLLRIELVRVEFTWLWARAALSVARDDPAQRQRMLGEARRCGKQLCKERLGWAPAVGEVVLAGAQALAGEQAAALARLERGQQLAEQHQMRPVVLAAAHVLRQGPADEWSKQDAERTIVRPERWTALFAPGFDS